MENQDKSLAREIAYCSKEAYVTALAFEKEAKALDICPAFWLAEWRLEDAVANGDKESAAFLAEVHHVMQAMEFYDADALYVLSA